MGFHLVWHEKNNNNKCWSEHEAACFEGGATLIPSHGEQSANPRSHDRTTPTSAAGKSAGGREKELTIIKHDPKETGNEKLLTANAMKECHIAVEFWPLGCRYNRNNLEK